MKRDGHELQKAIFTAIENEATLVDRFTVYAGADTLPQFSYDGMRSTWRDRAQALVEHRVSFSVWSPQAGFDDADKVNNQLSQTLADVQLTLPLRLVMFNLLLVDGQLDGASRHWRQRLTFLALTQNMDEL